MHNSRTSWEHRLKVLQKAKCRFLFSASDSTPGQISRERKTMSTPKNIGTNVPSSTRYGNQSLGCQSMNGHMKRGMTLTRTSLQVMGLGGPGPAHTHMAKLKSSMPSPRSQQLSRTLQWPHRKCPGSPVYGDRADSQSPGLGRWVDVWGCRSLLLLLPPLGHGGGTDGHILRSIIVTGVPCRRYPAVI